MDRSPNSTPSSSSLSRGSIVLLGVLGATFLFLAFITCYVIKQTPTNSLEMMNRWWS